MKVEFICPVLMADEDKRSEFIDKTIKHLNDHEEPKIPWEKNEIVFISASDSIKHNRCLVIVEWDGKEARFDVNFPKYRGGTMTLVKAQK